MSFNNQEDGRVMQQFTCSAAVTAFYPVCIDTATGLVATFGSGGAFGKATAIGIAQNSAAIGESVTVVVLGWTKAVTPAIGVPAVAANAGFDLTGLVGAAPAGAPGEFGKVLVASTATTPAEMLVNCLVANIL